MPGEPPDQEIGFPIDCAPAAGKCGERQTCAQLLRRARRAGAKHTKADRIAAEAGANVSARVDFEGGVSVELGENGRWRSPPCPPWFTRAKVGHNLQVCG